MNKKIDRRTLSRISWPHVKHNKSKQKLAIREAIEKAGNSRKLSFKTDVSEQLISNAVNYTPVISTTDIMSPRSSIKIEKGVKIKGLAEKICPSLKR